MLLATLVVGNMTVELNVYKTNYYPNFGRSSEYAQLKPEIVRMLQEGLSNVEIARRLGKRDQWVAKALNHYKLLSNSALQRLTLKDKIIKLYKLKKSVPEIANYLQVSIDKVSYYCYENKAAKLRDFKTSQIYELYDHGYLIEKIAEILSVPESYVRKILKDEPVRPAGWLDYTSKLEDKCLGIIAKNIRISYEELTKYLKL